MGYNQWYIHTTTNPRDSYVYTDVKVDHSQPFTSYQIA